MAVTKNGREFKKAIPCMADIDFKNIGIPEKPDNPAAGSPKQNNRLGMTKYTYFLGLWYISSASARNRVFMLLESMGCPCMLILGLSDGESSGLLIMA